MKITNFIGIIVLLTGTIMMYLTVPREKIKKLLPLGLIGGAGVAFVLVFFMQNLYGFWIFMRVDLVYLGGIPLFLSLVWIPLIIIFSYLMLKSSHILSQAVIIVLFPLGATLFHYYIITMGALLYRNWTLPLTFLVSLAIHGGISIYLYLTGQMKIY